MCVRYVRSNFVLKQIFNPTWPITCKRSRREFNVRFVIYGKIFTMQFIALLSLHYHCRYKNVETLRTHMQRHKDDRQHICNVCNKQCTTSSSLSAHIRYVHLKIKDFECSVCKKKFRRKLELTEHMARHTGQVLYTCPFCPKTFTSSSNYFSHRKYRHPSQLAESKSKKDE